MTVSAYNWYLLPKMGTGNIAIRQGVITAESEYEAKSYLLMSMTKEEKVLCESKDNILIVTPFHSWDIE